jgi:hypothetical protein
MVVKYDKRSNMTATFDIFLDSYAFYVRVHLSQPPTAYPLPYFHLCKRLP